MIKIKNIAIVIGVCLFSLIPLSAQAENVIEVLKIEGTISPVSAHRLDEALKSGIEKKAECLIIQLDTPGGLDKSMRQMVKAIMNSEVPVIVYVSPKGARAASAGVFITLASHIAVMAPGTNIGAAHPVAMGVGMDKETKEKVVNDASAYIKSIAQKRKRNVEWAEKAVRESVSITDEEALKLGIIDFIAEDIPDLLEKLDGREVKVAKGLLTLRTKGAELHFAKTSFREKFLQTLADPNLAYILLMVGIWGIILEFFHPGIMLPGIAGGICLILSLFALQILPFNLAGLLLIILAIILFVLEVKVPSYGALTIGGIIALTLGSLMLIDPSALYISISLSYIIPIVAITASLFVFIVSYAIKAQFKKPVTGVEGMTGEVGVAKSSLNPNGKVQIHGEIWNAVIQPDEGAVKRGEKVEVVKTEGMKLIVKKKEV
jgi:membrane-bound serine protease (ClpP class)